MGVDWHGEHLNIIQEDDGMVTILQYPYKTVFTPDEMKEIKQFVMEYVK